MEEVAKTSIRIQTEDGVGYLTLNRPERRNAFDLEMVQEWLAGFQELDGDDDVHAIVITGAGKAFCAGADVRSMHQCMVEGRNDETAGLVEVGNQLVLAVWDSKKPILAAVNGAAMGGAANLVLACDVRIAAHGARFGYPFHKLGLIPDWGGTYLLPHIVGDAKALELILSGESIDADEALRLGIVNRLAPSEMLIEEVRNFAKNLANADSERTAWIKERMRGGDRAALAAKLDVEAREQSRLMAGDEARRIIGEIVDHLNRKRA